MGDSVGGDRAIMLSGKRIARRTGALRRELWKVSAKPWGRGDYMCGPSK